MSLAWCFAMILACLLSVRVARATGAVPPFAVVHEATVVDDTIRWDSRVFRCRPDGEPDVPALTTNVAPFDARNVRIAPPLIAGASVQVVTFRDPERVFVPSADAAAWRTRNGFEVLHPDRDAREGVVACLRQQGVRLPPTALLVNADSTFAERGIAGTFVERRRGVHALLVAASAIFAAALAALGALALRFRRRARVEAAERILRADMPDF
jgi:hypothetical protein